MTRDDKLHSRPCKHVTQKMYDDFLQDLKRVGRINKCRRLLEEISKLAHGVTGNREPKENGETVAIDVGCYETFKRIGMKIVFKNSEKKNKKK